MRSIGTLIAIALLAAAGCGGTSGPAAPGAAPLPIVADTAHYTFYCAPGDSVDAQWQETYHEWATARLGVQLSRKIGYFKYRSRQDMGDHTGRYNTNGYADTARGEIHTLWSTDNHEVVHLFMAALGDAPGLFSEGVAVAFQTDPARADFQSRINGEEIHHAARRYLDSGLLVLPLDRIIETSGFRSLPDSTLSYCEAGSFVRFLMDRFGLDRVVGFFQSGVRSDDLRAAIKSRFRDAFGFEFEHAEAEWLEVLRALD
jgi:hypothetical protein